MQSLVWRIEARPTPFVPWVVMGHFARLEDACAKLPAMKRDGKFYAVRVRAN